MPLAAANRMSLSAYRREMGLPPVEAVPSWRGTGGARAISSVEVAASLPKTIRAKEVISKPQLAAMIRPPAATRPLKAEEALSHAVAVMLADMAAQGRLRALPICASTERNGGGHRAIVGRLVKRLLGAWPGQPDWVFVGACCGVLELKRPASERSARGDLSKEQRACRAVCRSLGVPHAVARTVEEARRALEEMGVIGGGT